MENIFLKTFSTFSKKFSAFFKYPPSGIKEFNEIKELIQRQLDLIEFYYQKKVFFF